MESFQITDIEKRGYRLAKGLQHTIVFAVDYLGSFAFLKTDKEEFTGRARHCAQLFRERAPSNWPFKWFLIFQRKSIGSELKTQYSALLDLKKNGRIKSRNIKSGGQFCYNLENYVREFLIQTGTSEVVRSGELFFSKDIIGCYICLCFLKELYRHLCLCYVQIKDPKK